MYKLTLFFSWQSDTPDNHRIIRNALIKACDTIRNEGTYDITYDESTWNESGSPVIEKTVNDKAKSCDIFVADVTPVGTIGKKDLPNPNVMFELGISKGHHIDDVILMLYTGDVKAEKMPFDINHHRLTKFSEKNITEFVRMMAETAANNPRYISVFDTNDKFLFYDRNIRKNIDSGKYLPDVFIDDRELKDHLRDFVVPYRFCKLVLDRCDMFDTYHTNRTLAISGKPRFYFDISEYKDCVSQESITEFYKKATNLKDYLRSKYETLYDYHLYNCLEYRKYEIEYEHLKFVTGKLLLITSSAGQGKTNLVCELADNVLIKRQIPFVYINGYEIDAENIGDSFAKIMLPENKQSFDFILREVATYCKYKRSPIILIIDGLNENPKPDIFSRNLELFLDTVLQYDCVKVIMTCRTEYYQECFTSLDKYINNKILRIEDLNQNLSSEKKNQLLYNYINYFRISVIFTEKIEELLCNDLLLLRIFCEANKGKTLGRIHNINREELFSEYYASLVMQLKEKIYKEKHYKIEDCKIHSFVRRIVEYMINNDVFFNVPLSNIMEGLSETDEEIFKRFLDENIIFRKDLTPNVKGAFARKEVVNFTYDAFRDYLLASYLLDIVADNDLNNFETLVSRYTVSNHQLKEGITPFLFVHTRNNMYSEAEAIISKMYWYEDTYIKNIWDINEAQINEIDVEHIKKLLTTDKKAYVVGHLIYYGRWNSKLFQKLNINILLEFLSSMNDDELATFFNSILPKSISQSAYNRTNKSPRELFVEELEQVLEDEMITAQEDFHKLFEFLLFMAGCSRNYVLNSYKRYLLKYMDTEQLERIYHNTNSDRLKSVISKLLMVL